MGARAQRLSVVLLVTAVLSSSGYGDPRDLSLVTRPVFSGLGSASDGIVPILVEVANRGPNTRGQVVVTSDSTMIRHPIDLPRGARKQFVAYLGDVNAYSDVHILLETTEGDIRFPVRLPEEHGEYVCLIGGSQGDLTFARSGEADPYGAYDTWRDAYGTPGSLPDRSIGYASFSAVVLGEGAERMTDVEVEALKGWVASGGTLIFIGGASPAVAMDKRWHGYVPVSGIRQQNVNSLPRIESLAGSPAPEATVTLGLGTVDPAAEVEFTSGGRNLIVRKGVGLGNCYYLSFDPFQPPLKQWQGMKKVLLNGLGTAKGLETKEWRLTATGFNYYDYDPYSDSIDSPFQAKLPPAGTVLLILFAHLIVSIPLNFYIMRKIGRGELAWVTTPIISIGFAAIFFSLASGLYEAGQSTRTRGLLIAGDHDETGIFHGRTEVFIPRSGTYDLQLKDVERVYQNSEPYYYGGGNMSPLSVVDEGSVRIPDMRVPNLAFKEFFLTQRVPSSGLVSLSAKRAGQNKLNLKVTNLSPHRMDGVNVQCAGMLYLVGVVEPGAEFSAVVNGVKSTQLPWAMNRTLALRATVAGMRLGPQIGEDKGSTVSLLYFGGIPE